MPEYDRKLFEEIKEDTKQRLVDYKNRDELFRQIYQMSIGEWERFKDLQDKGGHIIPIVSPDPANFIDGLVRILTPNSPGIKIPKDQYNPGAVQNADDLERVANAILTNAGRVRGDPIHFDIMRNAVVFSEVHVGMSSSWDLVKDYEKQLVGEKDKSRRRGLEIDRDRAKAVAEGTPYIIEVFNPRTGYPEWDKFGLASYLRKYKATVKELVSKFGDVALQSLSKGGKSDYKSYEPIDVCDYLDHRWHQIWLSEHNEPLMQEEHGLPFIPVVAEIIQGSFQGETPVLQRKPALYNYWKSGMWQADNLFFTITFNNIFALLSMPPFIEQQTTPNDSGSPELDFDAKPPRITVPYGKNLSQMQLKVITPDIMTLHDLAQAKGIESTMYRQAMGEPLSGQPSYSLVAFLAQSAKTVLNTIVEKTSWLIADVAKMGLKWMKNDAGTYTVKSGAGKVSIMSADIPEGDFQVECQLNVKLPQDRLGASQIVAQLSMIPNLPLSMEWMVEELLGVENVKDQRDKKWSEQVSQIEYQKYIQDQMAAEQQQAMQNAAMQEQAGQMGAQAQEQMAAQEQMGGVMGEPIPGQQAAPTGEPEQLPGQAMPPGSPTGPALPPRMIPPGRTL